MRQAAFAAALLDPDAALPEGLVGPDGAPAPRRFAVYRNNVTVGLIRALEAGFPVVRKLVGEAFFAAMAGEFVRAHPPKTRLMMVYGAEFPAFLQGFAPVASLGYLPDVARLEQAIRESYHAADATPVAAEALTGLAEDRLLAARLRLMPAVRLVRSVWPIHAIWQVNSGGGPEPVARAEDVLVLRPAFDPKPQLLPPGGGAFVAGLACGQSFADSLEQAGDALDLAAVLGLLLQGQAIEGIEE